MTASEQLNRIVQLVAELSRRQREAHPPATLSELAARFATTVAQIQSDIRTLTRLADDPRSDWLSSVRISQEGETLTLSSAGPFRRPVRLTPDELLALKVGLATERGGAKLAESLARTRMPLPDPALQGGDHEVPVALGDAAPDPALQGGDHEAPVALGDAAPPLVDLLHSAVAGSQCVELLYAGEGAGTGTARVIQPHQVVGFAGRTYVAAWCERVEDWRHFRVDRIVDALPTDRAFTQREDFVAIDGPGGVFREPDGGVDEVRVSFSVAIARWILERYPDAELREDGSVLVTYRVADVDWLVRRVLQYGPEAEVLEPEAYREAVRRAVGG